MITVLQKVTWSRSGRASPVDLISLAEPLACCLNGQEQAGVSQEDVVLIIGGGPIGCMHAVLAELHAAKKIIVTEKLEDRIDKIRRHTSCVVLNAKPPLKPAIDEIGVKEVDVILLATPEVSIDNSLLGLLAPGGRICIFSGPRLGNYEETIDIRSMHYREQMIVGAYGCSSRQNRKAVKLLSSGTLKLDWIITKRTNLENIKEAFDHSSARIGLKSLIDCF